MADLSVVIPVKDGERYLEQLLAALAAEGELEVLVIDSGSRDRSRQIARAAGVELLEIAPEQFGHGRTRNLGAERTSGRLIAFLTQDAVPRPGWREAYLEAFELTERIGAAYGPHLPWPDTSPMIARELEEFFASFSPDGRPAVQRAGEATFLPAYLSNVNACYLRDCWEEIRFEDVPYAEDQAFGRAMLEAGWAKVFHPGAAVVHAHDYGPLDFMRRYFDEYRGLRETIGHVEGFRPRAAAGEVRRRVRADRRWMRERGWPASRRLAWSGRAALHHGGRKAFSALGSRAERLPDAVQRSLSLERRGNRSQPAAVRPATAPGRPGLVLRGIAVGARLRADPYEEVARLAREGPAPLSEPVPGMAERERLRLALVIPPFRRGSGGHNSIFQIAERLERMGHVCSIWHYDPERRQDGDWPAVLRRAIVEDFAPVRAPVFKGFDHWHGTDVAIATGWETVYPAMLLPHCRARAYLVHDHEPEFFDTSIEGEWAEATYGLGLPCITAGSWLRDLMRERYGQWVPRSFRFGVDRAVYHPRGVERRRDTVIFYSRPATGRRAVPLGMLALAELRRRRPEVRIVLFGENRQAATSFPHEHLGVVSPQVLARHFSEATVGLCLSLTNYSIIPQEMLACGLPCVDVEGRSSEAVFGPEGPVELAAADPGALADAIEALLSDEKRWAARSHAGLEFVEGATWEAAAQEVEAGLRDVLRERERLGARAGTGAA